MKTIIEPFRIKSSSRSGSPPVEERERLLARRSLQPRSDCTADDVMIDLLTD